MLHAGDPRVKALGITSGNSPASLSGSDEAESCTQVDRSRHNDHGSLSLASLLIWLELLELLELPV